MNAMTASVIAATLTTPDDITRPADSSVGSDLVASVRGNLRRGSYGPDSTTSKSLAHSEESAAAVAPSATIAKTDNVDDVEFLANKEFDEIVRLGGRVGVKKAWNYT